MPALVCAHGDARRRPRRRVGRRARVALDAGVDPREISFAGPGKSEAELAQAVAAGILVNVESPREVELLARLSQALGRAGARRGARQSRFRAQVVGHEDGRRPEAVRHRRRSRCPTLLTRDRARSGSASKAFTSSAARRTCAPTRSAKRSTKTLELAVRLAQRAPAPVRTLNLGGGFGIPYFPGEQPLDLAPIGANLRAIVDARARRRCRRRALVIELGRYLVGEAGIYVCRVVDRKISRGQVFLVTDGGLHHHLAASRQLRPGDPQELSGRRSATRSPARAREMRIRRRTAVHAARSAGRPDGSRRGGAGRSRRRIPVRRLRRRRRARSGFLSHPDVREALV